MLGPLRELTANQGYSPPSSTSHSLFSFYILVVRQYHKDFYRMDNLCLIVTGKVPHAEFFNALKPVEAKVVSKGALPPITRPWTTPVPPFEKTADVDISFPSDDEEVGAALLGWRGPKYGVSNPFVVFYSFLF